MKHPKSRRNFLKQTGYITAASSLLASSVIPKVHAASTDTIKLAIVGCGNRGMKAAMQALNADPNLKFWAVADVFPNKAKLAVESLKKEFADQPQKIDVSPDRTFSEFDAYKKAMDSLDPGDVVLLTTPQAFRPLHFAYAVEKGLNVFAEKPVAIDIPGLKMMIEANKKAKQKGLKVAVGLNNRHVDRTRETVEAIHAGLLGDIYSSFVYRCQTAHSIGPRGNLSPLRHQLGNLFCFNWLTGSFIVDACVHNIDICCWANQQYPVSAFGIGGRLVRRAPDDLIDTACVQYTFADGKMMHLYTVTIPGTPRKFHAQIHGSKGNALLGEGELDPKLYEYGPGGKAFWAPKAGKNDSYQTEHDRLFKAIRDGVEKNEMDYGINSTFTAIMGRMASETSRPVTAEEAWASTFQWAPNLDKLTLDSDSPTMPDENENYPIPIPGKATVNNPYAV